MSNRAKTGMHILIVDDEPLARNRLLALCERLENIGRVELAAGGEQALDMIDTHGPDLLLLDVDMPDLSGMDVARHCRSLPHMPEIIFTTAHSKYAVEAFRLEATDYLLKPVKQVLLAEAIDRAANRLNGREAKTELASYRIWVRDNTGSVQIECSDIGWISAERDYMRINLPGRSYLVHEPMHALAGRLPAHMFVRIHRSTLVRRDFIHEFRREGRQRLVVLKDGTALGVGPSYSGGLGMSDTVTE